jgi:hypothetical protein
MYAGEGSEQNLDRLKGLAFGSAHVITKQYPETHSQNLPLYLCWQYLDLSLA